MVAINAPSPIGTGASKPGNLVMENTQRLQTPTLNRPSFLFAIWRKRSCDPAFGSKQFPITERGLNELRAWIRERIPGELPEGGFLNVYLYLPVWVDPLTGMAHRRKTEPSPLWQTKLGYDGRQDWAAVVQPGPRYRQQIQFPLDLYGVPSPR